MARTVTGSTGGRTNRKFLIVAILFAALTAVIFYALTARGGGSSQPSTASPGDQQVVVAKVAIKERTAITADMLEVKSVPLNTVISGAYTSIADATGKVTKFPIAPNQQLVQGFVVDTARPTGNEALSLVVPAGRRAISIQASQVINAGGLILPGDYVDVIWGCCADQIVITKTILKNVQVAAVAQSLVNSGPVVEATPASGKSSAPSSTAATADGGKPLADAVTVTLLLTPEEAQQVFLAEQSGKLRAELRGFGDQEVAPTANSTLIQLLPLSDISVLPEGLKPNGYKKEQQ
ncbi:MAG: Flp pilus assembly protein CpaB [Chloroflexi bacterium]|nr:Flp pilus assembly protein CpaB [Chloroflexota bacterium]